MEIANVVRLAPNQSLSRPAIWKLATAPAAIISKGRASCPSDSSSFSEMLGILEAQMPSKAPFSRKAADTADQLRNLELLEFIAVVCQSKGSEKICDAGRTLP